MSVAMKTLGALGVALLGLVVYLSVYVLQFYHLFYFGLGMTFVMLGIIVVLTAGRQGTA